MLTAPQEPFSFGPRMEKVYVGCLEAPAGFQPVRDPSSKWYMSYEEMSDKVAPRGVRYLAGWGYVLSRDVAEHLLRAVDAYSRHPETQPGFLLPPPFLRPLPSLHAHIGGFVDLL